MCSAIAKVLVRVKYYYALQRAAFPSLVDKLTNEVEYRARSGVSSPCSTSSWIPSKPEPVIKAIDQRQTANTEADSPVTVSI
jgi:hypothetical protein